VSDGGRKRIFVMGGGAALGAHQAGALQYLDEQGIKPDVLIGSSIGVVNSCVYASVGAQGVVQAWKEFQAFPRMFYPTLRNNPFTGLALSSIERLASGIEEFIDFPGLMDSSIDLEFILLNLSTGRGEMWSKRHCRDWRELRTLSRAGYSIPPLFPPVEFQGQQFVDGGLAWNVPLGYAIELEATEIYVLAPVSSTLPYLPPVTGRVAYLRRLADVLFRTIGNVGRIHASLDGGLFHGVPVTVIEPGEEFSGAGLRLLFHSSPEKAERLLAAGYRDAKRAVNRPAVEEPVGRLHAV